MRLQGKRGPWIGAALAALLGCALSGAVSAQGRIADPGDFLRTTEQLRITDHPEFLKRLEWIHRESPVMTAEERWHLAYLDAWESLFEGYYAKSEDQLKDVIEHAGDRNLAAEASALLISNYSIRRKYDEAFVLANTLTLQLPQITNGSTRLKVLTHLSQTFNFAGQTELAIKYAQMMADATPQGENLCYPLTDRLFALSNAGTVTADSPEYAKTLHACIAGKQPVIANSIQLDRGTHLLKEGRPAETLAMLDRIQPSLQNNHYQPHLFSAKVQRAMAYEKLGLDAKARKAAHEAIESTNAGDASEWLRDAYHVLYDLAKKRGDTASALQHYEHYVAQNQGYLDDVSARSLAFQLVKQKALSKKLENEELNRQNSILKLQQALDAKAVETSRLYIGFLLAALTFIAAWLIRLKRSQLRFKRMSFHDGLTGIYNHQHFVTESERVLRALEKRPGHGCLISIDLDHFKQINDTYGHAMGDAVLKRTVTICQAQLRPGDIFGRLGGEEFGVLLPDCPRAQGMEVANRLLATVGGTPMEKDGMLVSVSASVGLAFTDSAGYDLQQLCKEADDALYRAKRGGRNQVVADTENPKMAEA